MPLPLRTKGQQPEAADVLLDMLTERWAQRLKAVSSTPSTVRGHGATGVFSQYGVNPRVINAQVSPIAGLAQRLPIRLSNYTHEVLQILTGQTASTGDEPTTACADAKQPGNLKVCNQTWPFGRIVMDGQVLQVDRAGELLNRSEFMDYTVAGDPFAKMDSPLPASLAAALKSESKKKIFELMFSLHRDYGHLLYDGNPGNTAGSTGYIEFNGLDRLINTGYRDVYSNQACKAADSLVKSFGSVSVTTNATWAVTLITETMRYLTYLAERTGQSPVTYALAMRYSLFFALTEIWPCAYSTYRCRTAAPGSDAQVVIDGREQETMRQAMRDGMYLLVDGKQVEVVLDEYIAETEPSTGTFESDIYIVPLTAGGQPATFWEYFNLAGPGGMQEAIQDMAKGSFEVLGGGRYWIHYKPPTNECVQIRIGYKPRLILRTPFLAARLTDFRYTPLIHERSPFPGDADFYNGGNTSFVAPYFYANF